MIAVVLLGWCGLAAAQDSIETQPAPCPDYAVPATPPGLGVDRHCFSFHALAGEQVRAACTGRRFWYYYAYSFSCQAFIGPVGGNGFEASASDDWVAYTCSRTGDYVLETVYVGEFVSTIIEGFRLERVSLPTCAADDNALCLGGWRFRVTADWRTPDGASGHGTAVSLTQEAGYFAFFDAVNVELVVKVHDGCGFNDRWWVFAGGLTNVQVDLTVTDTLTGSARNYVNPQATAFQPVQDTAAFPCP